MINSPLTQAQLKEWLTSYMVILFDAMHCVDTLKMLEADNEGEQVIARTGFAHMMWNLYEGVMINSLDKLCYDGHYNHHTIRKLYGALLKLKGEPWLMERLEKAPPKTVRWTSWEDVERFADVTKAILKDHRDLTKLIHDYRDNVVGHTWASFAPNQKPRPILRDIEMVEAQKLIDELQISYLEVSGGVFGDPTFPVTSSVTLQQIIDKVKHTT